VKIQKEFKVTPHYIEMEHDAELGYKMGVYLCVGQPIHSVNIMEDAVTIHELKRMTTIHEYISQHGKILMYMGEGQHIIKRKAEQVACSMALETFLKYE